MGHLADRLQADAVDREPGEDVEVRSWDRQTNKAIRAKVDARAIPRIKVNSDLLPLLTQPGCQPREEVVVERAAAHAAAGASAGRWRSCRTG